MIKFKQNETLSRIVADITGDGHLQLYNHKGVVSFTCKYKDAVLKEHERFLKLFRKNGSVKKYESRGYEFYRLYVASLKIATFLKSVGVPSGNKTKVSFHVPSWIMNGSYKIKRNYLRGLFTSEGLVYSTRGKKDRWRIEIEQYKEVSVKNPKIFMEDIRNLLLEVGINSSPVRFGKVQKRKDGSKTMAIKMDIESRYFERFYKYIGFDDKLKTNKLLKVIAGGPTRG